MWVVDHMLVEHRIWVADDKCRQLLKFLLSRDIVLVELFAGSWEEHSINLALAIALDPDVLAVESARQHFAHLLILAEERREAATAGCALAEAV